MIRLMKVLNEKRQFKDFNYNIINLAVNGLFVLALFTLSNLVNLGTIRDNGNVCAATGGYHGGGGSGM
ncbi:MAG: hypothetical protein JNL11_11490 [Bdellovibrionaceae bacterium]|nr:hypothetical protein [Pseudobdellovibrionaceae bacterium]